MFIIISITIVIHVNFIYALSCKYMHLMHTQVESELERGNRAGARNASEMARKWGVAGLVTGIVITVVSFFVALLAHFVLS